MMTLGHLLLALSLTDAVPAFARETGTTCDVDAIRNALFTPAPTRSGIARLLDRLLDANSVESKCLADAGAGTPALAEGQAFRAAFLNTYASISADAGDQRLLLTPDQEILRRAYAVAEAGTQRRGDGNAPDWMIEQRALTETRSQFGMSNATTLGQLERQGRGGDFRFARALQFYRVRVQRLRENMRVDRKSVDRTPDRFKSEMLTRLNALRVANLKAAARESVAERGDSQFKFTDVQTTAVARITSVELSTSRVDFLGDASAADSTLTEAPRARRAGLFTRIYTALGALTGSQAEPTRVEDLQHPGVVQITPPEGTPVFIRGRDFAKILAALGPVDPTNHLGPAPAVHRFRNEVAARDALLANAGHALIEKWDRSLDDLAQRFRTRLSRRVLDQTTATPVLAYEIQNGGARVLADDVGTNALWYGWAKSPDFWNARIRVAQNLEAPAYDARDAKMPAGKALRKAETNATIRYASEDERARRFTTKVGARTTSIAVLSSVGLFVANNFSALGTLPKWDLLGWALPDAAMAFDQPIEAQNYKLGDQAGKGDGKFKTLADPHDPGASPYHVEILHRENAAPVPLSYNFATSTHIAQENATPNRIYVSAQAQFDLAIDVNVRNRAGKGNRIGLVQMDQYRMVGLMLYDWRGQLVPETAYEIYDLPQSRQTYADVRGASGPFTYRAFYRFTPETYRIDAFAGGVPSAALAKVTTRLDDSGFTNLSRDLRKANRSSTIDYDDLARAFSKSATYTTDGKMWKVNAKADPTFRPFTKFLNGPQLNYQCTGSNLLYQTAVNETLRLTPNETHVTARPLVGFGGGGDKGIKRGTPGHLHTLLTGDDQAYLETDATPAGVGTARPEAPTTPEQEPAQPADQAPAEPVKPNGSWVQIWKEAIPAKAPQLPKPNAPAPEPEPTVRVARRPIDAGKLPGILARIARARALAVEATQGGFEHNPRLRGQHFAQIPGLRLLVLSKILLEEAQAGSTPGQLLARLLDPTSAPRPPARTDAFVGRDLRAFFEQELLVVQNALDTTRADLRSGAGSVLEELTMEPVRGRLIHLAELMATYPWDQLLGAAPKCADDLAVHAAAK